MGNTALKAVCVRDDSLDMYTDVVDDSYHSPGTDTNDDEPVIEKTFNSALGDLRWDGDLVSLHLQTKDDVHEDQSERSATRQSRRRSPIKVLRAIVSPSTSVTTTKSPQDAYEEVCDQFNVIFDKNAPFSKPVLPEMNTTNSNDVELRVERVDEMSCPDGLTESCSSLPAANAQPELPKSMDEPQVTPLISVKTLADWPAHTWKIEDAIRETNDEDDLCSTACSSEYATDLSDDDEVDSADHLVSTFACSYRRSLSSMSSTPISQDDIPFVFAARSHFIVSDYICPCNDCPWYSVIDKHVRQSVHGVSTKVKGQVIRLLQAYSTYNEVMGFRPGMVQIARDCLFTSCGHENDAFESFVMCVESEYANGWI
ncbi:hypothetical protein DYB32_008133 [Aphanomyces invadans]|uniref:Uncharacterized protein n=1 Tax=Aphanomyces invadans TaxID=157072 RepID=A0A418AM40_9STRA|nr:hypothetical protein DYB32_008133 [Aphanomyces invadans]